MSDIVVVFYSRTGKTRMVARKLAELLNADLQEITEAKDRRGVTGFLGAIFAALRKRPTRLTSRHSLEGKSSVVLGMPVWAESPPPAVVTYLRSVDLSAKHIWAFCTHGGSGGKGMFRKLAEMLPAPPEDTLSLKNPREDDPALQQTLADWAGRIMR